MATKLSPPKDSMQEQEVLRSSIDGKKLLKEIDRITKELLALNKDIKDAKNSRPFPTRVHDTIIRVEARRKVLETVLKTKKDLLDKLVSDRKSVEVAAPGGKDLFAGFASAIVDITKRNSKR